MESTITKYEKRVVEGVHRSYTSQMGKKMWSFNIEFSNGSKGECSSTKEDGSYKVGDIVTFDSVEGQYGTRISNIKKVQSNANQQVAKSSYNDPQTVKEIALSVCQSCSIKQFEYQMKEPKEVEDLNKVAKYYQAWCIKDIAESDPKYRDKVSRRYYALQQAIECMKFPSLGLCKDKINEAVPEIIKVADKMLLLYANESV